MGMHILLEVTKQCLQLHELYIGVTFGDICRHLMIYLQKWWRQCWRGRSWCCTPVTLMAMMTSVRSSLASHQPVSKVHSPCWLRFARSGDT